MEYTEFKEEMKKRIKEFLPEQYGDCRVDIIPLRKNNGIMRDGLIIRGMESAVPALPLNDCYEAYKAGVSLKSILEQAAEVYTANLGTHNSFGAQVLEYGKAKEYLGVEVCNADKNAELLKSVPHERREDLALIYCVRRPVGERGWESAVVNHGMLKHWNMEEQELKAEAWKNMKRNSPPAFSSIEAVITDMLSAQPKMQEEMKDLSSIPLYVLSNKEGTWGASYMFDSETMANIAEKLDSSLIILPSSIHEVLILSESADMNMEISELQDMVRTVNQLEMKDAEVLSDNVYCFDREEQTVTMFQPSEPSQGMNLNF